MKYLIFTLVFLMTTAEAAPKKKAPKKRSTPPKNVRPIDGGGAANAPISPYEDVPDQYVKVGEDGILYVVLGTKKFKANPQVWARNCELLSHMNPQTLNSIQGVQKVWETCQKEFKSQQPTSYIFKGVGVDGQMASNLRVSKDLKNITMIEKRDNTPADIKKTKRSFKMVNRPLTAEEKMKLYFANEKARDLVTGKLKFEAPYSEAVQDMIRPPVVDMVSPAIGEAVTEANKSKIRRIPLANLFSEVYKDPAGNSLFKIRGMNSYYYLDTKTGHFSDMAKVPGVGVTNKPDGATFICGGDKEIRLQPQPNVDSWKVIKEKFSAIGTGVIIAKNPQTPCQAAPLVSVQPIAQVGPAVQAPAAAIAEHIVP